MKSCSHVGWCACTKRDTYPHRTLIARITNWIVGEEIYLVVLALVTLCAVFLAGLSIGTTNATTRFISALPPAPTPEIVVQHEPVRAIQYMVPDACLEAIFGFRNYIADLTDWYNGNPDPLLAQGPDYIGEVIAWADSCESMRTYD